MQKHEHGFFPGPRRPHSRTARSYFVASCTLAVVLSCGQVDRPAPTPTPVLRSAPFALGGSPFPIGHPQLQPRTDLELFALEGGPSAFLALYGTGSELVATRVAADGTVLDPRGILVAGDAFTNRTVGATAVGADWLIAYSRPNPSAVNRTEAVVRKLQSDGTFAGEAIPLAPALVAGKLAFDGTRALLLLHSDGPFPGGTAPDVTAVALDTDGNPLGPIFQSYTRTPCCNLWNARWPQDIAAKESAFLVAYSYNSGGVIRATADGGFSSPMVLGSTPYSVTGVATDGNRWLALVAAGQYRELADDGNQLTTVNEGALPALNYIDLGFQAGAYTLFAKRDDSTGLFGIRLKPPEVGEPQRLTSGIEGYETRGVGTASNGTDALLYDGFRIGPLTAEPLSFAPKGPLQLIDSPAWEPRVASNDQCSLVVYWDVRHYTENPFNSAPRLYATRLGEDGAPLDDHDILIDMRLDGGRVVANDRDFLLVGLGAEEGVVTRLMTGEGELGSTQVGPTNADAPTAASDGEGFLVTFGLRRENPPGEIETIFNYFVVSSTGEHGPVHQIPSPSGPGAQAIVFNGSEYVVFWVAQQASLSPAIYAMRISRSGVLLDTSPRFIAQAETGYPVDGYHEVDGKLQAAFDGEGYLLTWRVRQNYWDYRILLASVSSALDPVETYLVVDGDVDIGNEALRPQLVYTNDHYWLLWRNVTVRGSPLVRLLQIETDGSIRRPSVELTPFPPGVSGAPQVDYDVPTFGAVHVGGDRLLITYDLASNQTRRIEGRFFGQLLPDGDDCRSDRDCQSGTCAAGLCCSSCEGGEAGNGGAPAQAGAAGESGGGAVEAGTGGDVCGAGGSGGAPIGAGGHSGETTTDDAGASGHGVGGVGGEGAGGSSGASEAGEAGVAGSAASPARGGSGGRAGGAGTGGAGQAGQPARGGSAGAGGSSSGPPDEGCSCRMPGAQGPQRAGAVLALIAFGLLLRRRCDRENERL